MFAIMAEHLKNCLQLPSQQTPQLDECSFSENIKFTNEQQNVINIMKQQIQCLCENNNSSMVDVPKKIIVQGIAGTGKSVIIRQITSIVKSEFGNDSILLMAPSGIAALNINGSTIHSKLNIMPQQQFEPLKGNASRNFEIMMQKC